MPGSIVCGAVQPLPSYVVTRPTGSMAAQKACEAQDTDHKGVCGSIFAGPVCGVMTWRSSQFNGLLRGTWAYTAP